MDPSEAPPSKRQKKDNDSENPPATSHDVEEQRMCRYCLTVCALTGIIPVQILGRTVCTLTGIFFLLALCHANTGPDDVYEAGHTV